MPHEARRDYFYLADIVDSARTISRWLADHDDQWDDDEILRNAVLRQLSVIGEAASSISEDVRNRMPGIPWREIRGFRNIAIHAYFSLDWAIVHEVATGNLPGMEEQVLALLRADDPEIAAKFDVDTAGSDERSDEPATGSEADST